VPSEVNNILIINKVITPGRVTAIIVNERLAAEHRYGARAASRVGGS
jgi:hypothetical protein